MATENASNNKSNSLSRKDFIKLGSLVIGAPFMGGSLPNLFEERSENTSHGEVYAFTTGIGPNSLALVMNRREGTIRVVNGESQTTNDLTLSGEQMPSTAMSDFNEITSPLGSPLIETEKPVGHYVGDTMTEIKRAFQFPVSFTADLMILGLNKDVETNIYKEKVRENIIESTKTEREEAIGIATIRLTEDRHGNIMSASFSARLDPREYKKGYSGPNIETSEVEILELATKTDKNAAVEMPGIVNTKVFINGVAEKPAKPNIPLPEGEIKTFSDKLSSAGYEIRMENAQYAMIYEKDSNIPLNDVRIDLTNPNKPVWSRHYTYLDFTGHPYADVINNEVNLPQPMEKITVDPDGKLAFDFPGYTWNTETNLFERETLDGEPTLSLFEAKLQIIEDGDLMMQTFTGTDFFRFNGGYGKPGKYNKLEQFVNGKGFHASIIPMEDEYGEYHLIKTTQFLVSNFLDVPYSYIVYKSKDNQWKMIVVDAKAPGSWAPETLGEWSDYFKNHAPVWK